MIQITKPTKILCLLVGLLIAACQPQESGASLETQDQINQDDENKNSQAQLKLFAEHLKISYRLVDNRPQKQCSKSIADGHCFLAEFKLQLRQPIEVDNWIIYFSFMTPVRETLSEEFEIQHVNGDLHAMKPTAKFDGWKNGAAKVIPFKAAFWQLSEFDVPPNFYVVGADSKPYIIESTRASINQQTLLEELTFIEPFGRSDSQSQRTANDRSKLATAGNLFVHNQIQTKAVDRTHLRIIPQPRQVKVDSKQRQLDLSSGVQLLDNDFKLDERNPAIRRLELLGVKVTPDAGVPLKLIRSHQLKGDESYRLNIDDSKIEITAVSAQGAFYGLQSLNALLMPGHNSIPIMQVNDSPRFAFRGLHLDVARNFRDKDFVARLLSQMAAYKLNKLHLHLGDDEGWRLEIPDLPELTLVGAQRCHDLSEQTCLLPQLGSGPTFDNPNNGFYSVDDYTYILQTAAAHHIQVIPSFDMPGHSRAAVKSMQMRYRKYQATGQMELAKEFLLSDINDQSDYLSVQYYNDNTLNVCKESTYRFVEKVLQSVITIHDQAQVPLTTYHIGADETAGAWKASPECQNFIQDKQLKTEQLSDYFIRRVAAFLAEKNIVVAGWSDGLAHLAKADLPSKVQINVWKPLFWAGHKEAHSSANKDWQVVVSSPDVTYFDFPYEADPKERGYYWGSRYTNTRQVFELMPENLPLHAEIWSDRENLPFVSDDRNDTNADKPYRPMQQGKRFFGLQGHLWSEMVRSDQIAEYMLFPRLIALAERAWHRADWEPDYRHQGEVYSQQTQFFGEAQRQARDQQWLGFARSVAIKEMPKLDLAGWHYRLPTLGAKIESGKLFINSAFPGLIMQYQIDKGGWLDYPLTLQGVEVEPGKQVRVRAKAPKSQRYGRSLVVDN